jgi:hypothetical protein
MVDGGGVVTIAVIGGGVDPIVGGCMKSKRSNQYEHKRYNVICRQKIPCTNKNENINIKIVSCTYSHYYSLQPPLLGY